MKLTGHHQPSWPCLQRGTDQNAGCTHRHIFLAVLFGLAYVSLDWISYIDAFQHFNISAWSPAPALGILFLLGRGPGGPVTLYLALVAADLLVRGQMNVAPAMLILNLILTMCYVGMTELLRRYAGDGGMFVELRSLTKWIAIVIIGSLVNGVIFVSGMVTLHLMPFDEWMKAIIQFWIGNAVGIVVGAPLFWWLLDQRRRKLLVSALFQWETLGYVSLAVVMLYLALGPIPSANFRYLYILFLPLGWAASRQGLIGAVLCASLLQAGMLLTGWLWGVAGGSIVEIQMRALLLAGVGFLIGVAVDEQKRAVLELRQSLRLAAAGEMAAALAHELNQPLTALSAYGAAIEHLLRRDGGSDQLRDVVRRMLGEASRAAEVVRRLRDFFRTGTTHLELVVLEDLFETALKNFVEKAPSLGIEMTVDPPPDVVLQVDRLQIEVVLRNLLANAFEALPAVADGIRQVSVTAAVHSADQLSISVKDSGGGVSVDMSDGAFEPFVSTKSNGLGLGLAISRAIAEAHDGKLVAEAAGHGSFTLFLPIHGTKDAPGE
jgi:two-component system sensor kinase FixL